jgi:hypothetical protein
MPSERMFQLERIPRSPVSSEEILSDIRRVAKLVAPKTISFRVYNEFGTHSSSTVALRFGTWNKAILAAGLDIGSERSISDERLFENLMRLWEYYGRQPRIRDLSRSPSNASYGPYERRFHSWTKALEQFVIYANSKGASPPISDEVTENRKPGRTVSLRTRYRVLKRDNFSCCACGATPALMPGLQLHVDHIKPWSHDGETFEDNLQTLCEACNLGKSNVL